MVIAFGPFATCPKIRTDWTGGVGISGTGTRLESGDQLPAWGGEAIRVLFSLSKPFGTLQRSICGEHDQFPVNVHQCAIVAPEAYVLPRRTGISVKRQLLQKSGLARNPRKRRVDITK
jgi:hypothetical protein